MNIELQHSMSEEKWHAIMNNDSSFDGKFFYGVKTTGIFCRPSCRSRIPNQENVRTFSSIQHALDEGFRPCKRCKPGGLLMPDEDWVETISSYIDNNYKERLTLTALAAVCHGSPYHLQRTFKRIKGLTPHEYMQRVRMSKATKLLLLSNSDTKRIAESVGIPNTKHFATLFKKATGYSPTQYRFRYGKGQE